MAESFWVSNFPGGVGQPSAPAYGGGGTDIMSARNPLDAKRQAAGFAPGASYPDGYLGTLTNPQSDRDKIPAVLQSRLTSTSYHRGVHAGDLQPKSAYSWSDDMNPTMGLQRQSEAVMADQEGGIVYRTQRMAPTGDPVEMIANDGKMAGKTSREIEKAIRDRGGDPARSPVTQVSPSRAAQMRANYSLPGWSGVRGGAI